METYIYIHGEARYIRDDDDGAKVLSDVYMREREIGSCSAYKRRERRVCVCPPENPVASF